MAADAVDAAAEDMPARVDAVDHREGAAARAPTATSRWSTRPTALARDHGLHPYRIEHLLDRYGSLIDDVLSLAAGRPDLLAAARRAPTTTCRSRPSTRLTHEGALHLEDVLARRTRISIEYAHRGVDCAGGRAADRAGARLGRRRAVDREVATYLARVDAELRSQAQPDDESADALRAAAPEAREQILEPVPIGK